MVYKLARDWHTGLPILVAVPIHWGGGEGGVRAKSGDLAF